MLLRDYSGMDGGFSGLMAREDSIRVEALLKTSWG